MNRQNVNKRKKAYDTLQPPKKDLRSSEKTLILNPEAKESLAERRKRLKECEETQEKLARHRKRQKERGYEEAFAEIPDVPIPENPGYEFWDTDLEDLPGAMTVTGGSCAIGDFNREVAQTHTSIVRNLHTGNFDVMTNSGNNRAISSINPLSVPEPREVLSQVIPEPFYTKHWFLVTTGVGGGIASALEIIDKLF